MSQNDGKMATKSSSGSNRSSPRLSVSSAGRTDTSRTRDEYLSATVATLRERLGKSYIDSAELKIHKTVGEGAFATVQLAEYKGYVVAVKILHPEMFANDREILNFLHEVRLLRKLDHTCIVKFLGGGGVDLEPCDFPGVEQPLHEDLFLVQEYCEGGSLQSLVAKQLCEPFKKLYSDADALRWCMQLASALNYLHSAKPLVVHRDLKLDNCLLTHADVSSANLKLADFGLAKLMRQSTAAKKLTNHLELSWGPGIDEITAITGNNTYQRIAFGKALEVENAQLAPQLKTSLAAGNSALKEELTGQTGSFTYMAPEVIRGELYDEKADVFSFAMVAYNIFHRTIPSVQLLVNGSPEDVENYAKEVATGYRPPLGKSAIVNDEIIELIEWCWQQRSEDRPCMRDVFVRLCELEALGVCKGEQHIKENNCGCLMI